MKVDFIQFEPTNINKFADVCKDMGGKFEDDTCVIEDAKIKLVDESVIFDINLPNYKNKKHRLDGVKRVRYGKGKTNRFNVHLLYFEGDDALYIRLDRNKYGDRKRVLFVSDVIDGFVIGWRDKDIPDFTEEDENGE